LGSALLVPVPVPLLLPVPVLALALVLARALVEAVPVAVVDCARGCHL
jgi:hypothetical protein